MKKVWIALGAIVLAFLLSGCKAAGQPESSKIGHGTPAQEEGEALQVLLDIDLSGLTSFSNDTNLGNMLAQNLKYNGVDIGEVEYEYLPGSGEDREAALTNLRVEIMSGKGPDLFICDCTYNNSEAEPIFRFPDRAMANRFFLPLDSYIENARFMDWSSLNPTIMEAGRDEEGQQILPLTFSLPVTCIRQEDFSETLPKDIDLDSMLKKGGKYALAVSGVSPYTLHSSAFLKLAEYESNELLITKDSLQSFVEDLHHTTEKVLNEDIPPYFRADLAVGFIMSADQDISHYNVNSEVNDGLREFDDLTMVPMYSYEGGYCAFVTSFAAVSRNSKRAEDAFLFLDYLLSDAGGRSSLYGKIAYGVGMPVNMELCQEEAPISDINGLKWYFTDKNYQAYRSLCENISSVRFNTSLDRSITDLVFAYDRNQYLASQGEEAQSLEELTSQTIRVMTMELAES